MEFSVSSKLNDMPTIIYRASSENPPIEQELSSWGISNYRKHYDKYSPQKYKDWKHLLLDDGLMQTPLELSYSINIIDAIVDWYDNTDDEICIVADENVTFKNAKRWQFDWTFLMQQLPYNWDCIQLFVYCSEALKMHMHPWIKSNRGQQCFMITRYFAKRLKHFHYIEEKFKLYYDTPDKSIPIDSYGSMDTFFYDLGITYTFPVFSLIKNSTSSYLPEMCSEGIDYWWEDKAPLYSNFELFNYNKGDDEWKMDQYFDVDSSKNKVYMDERRPRLIWI
jgi:hypothetical protein